ncbi:unnamed protein product [Victoria cruziana]
MRERLSLNLRILLFVILLDCVYDCQSKTWGSLQDTWKYDHSLRHTSALYQLNLNKLEKHNAVSPVPPPKNAPDAFMPLLAPSSLSPFGNSSTPILSGACLLNFSAADNMVEMTAVDCWGLFAPFLANVICCPQLQATLTVLIGESSKTSGLLALDMNRAKYCLSDVQTILSSQGANENLQQICSIQPSNLTEVDAVKECCSQVCQNAVSEAARRIALTESSLPEQSTAIVDCQRVVYRWLASKLDPDSAKKVLRRISNCNVNKVCPLVLPTIRNVSRDCGGTIRNQTTCCKTLANYISHLQKQSFITNLQALNCAALLGVQLQKANITSNIYDLCHVTLKDFSLQVGSQESGCLLPSLPSDAARDSTSGISFTCDLNDIIAAPWPSASLGSTASCNKSITLPALPAATSSQDGHGKKTMPSLLLASVMALAAL